MKLAKNPLLILLLICSIGILTGCASITPAAPEQAPAVPPEATQDNSLTELAEPVADLEMLPNVDLTNEIFFKVISAEVAFQRGEFPSAFATMVSVAQQTRDPRLSKRALQMAVVAKQPAQAFYAARQWYSLAPGSDEATQYYVGFLILNNNWDEVKGLLTSHLERVSSKQRGLLILQIERLVMRSANKDAAFKTLEDLYAPYPEMIETHLALAQAAYESGNAVRAMVEARVALRINPASQLGILTVAQVSPTPADALTALSDFLVRYPHDIEVRRAYANMLIEQKQYAQARSQFQTLLTENPKDTGVLYTLGVLSLQLNDTAQAEDYLKAFVNSVDAPEQRDPTNAYLYLAQIADDRKDGAAALDWLARVPSFEGKNAAFFNAQLRRALMMSKYQSLEQARQFLHQLQATPEEQLQVLQLDAELLRNADRNQEAMDILQDALKTHPDSADLLYDYAMVCEKLDRVDDMEKALRRVIEINPDNQQAYNALGYSLADRNLRLGEARTLIEKALSMAPDDAFIIDSMGWLEFREHNNESALKTLQRAYQLRPDAEIAVHVGEVLWTMGQQQQAIDIWKEARNKDPGNLTLKNTLERLKVGL